MEPVAIHPLGRKDRPAHRSTGSNPYREPSPPANKATARVWASCASISTIPNSDSENAAARALRFSNLSLKALRKILENGLDRLEEKDSGSTAVLPAHDNIRGGQYYH